MNNEEPKNIETGSRRVNKGRPLVYILSAVVATFIFLCWLYLLPYILKKEQKLDEQKNSFQKVNEEAVDTLDEVKEIINEMGEKLKEVRQTTSTQAAEIVNSEVDINILKDKILEYNNQEK